jgi:hypothetical protein
MARVTIAQLDALDQVPAPPSATKFTVADLDALDATPTPPAPPITAAAPRRRITMAELEVVMACPPAADWAALDSAAGAIRRWPRGKVHGRELVGEAVMTTPAP